MSVGESSGPIHPVPTRRSGYRYLFYDKHHGRGGPDAAQWLPTLSHDEEFLVFDIADFHDLSDERGCLYGVQFRTHGVIPRLGTGGEQIAEYPRARANEPWHGYPVWPVSGQQNRPPRIVFLALENANLLTTRERKRLEKGKPA